MTLSVVLPKLICASEKQASVQSLHYSIYNQLLCYVYFILMFLSLLNSSYQS